MKDSTWMSDISYGLGLGDQMHRCRMYSEQRTNGHHMWDNSLQRRFVSVSRLVDYFWMLVDSMCWR